jgi:hypothetical protein
MKSISSAKIAKVHKNGGSSVDEGTKLAVRLANLRLDSAVRRGESDVSARTGVTSPTAPVVPTRSSDRTTVHVDESCVNPLTADVPHFPASTVAAAEAGGTRIPAASPHMSYLS